MTLAKATLVAISADAHPTEQGTPIEVQFNPTSMRLAMTNSIDVGSARGREAARHLETSATTLSLDLVFDTADQASADGEAVNVRDLSKGVSRFVLPEVQGSRKQAPPRVRFAWGTFVFDGVMSQLTEDIDLFSETGVPLRSKVSIAVKEQNPEFIAGRLGPAAATGAGASPPGGGGAGPGSAGSGGDSTGLALGGESAADFAARMGLDPAAWRGLAGGLSSTLSLSAGIEIDFSAGLSVSAGIGTSGGAEAGAATSPEAAFGLAPAAGGGGGGGTPAQAGFALAAGGGVRAAVESVEIAKASDAAAQTRAAFAASPSPVPGAAVSPRPAAPDQPHPRLATQGLPAPGAQAPPAPARPLADPRATSFGFGIPLRPRIEGAAAERGAATSGWINVRARERDPMAVPLVRDPTAPPWTALPAVAPSGAHTDGPGCSCGCGGGCR